MQFNDRVSIERVRRLGNGGIAAVARVARSGVYQYAGSEVGRPDLSTVNVYRADDEVFSEDAMASFTHKAITLDHPKESVSAANWRKVAVGYTEGRVARDGGFLEVPLMLADAEAVSAVESGRMKELSAGYTCQLIWGDGVAPSGERYQARQVGIRADHVALVSQGRAGPECRVGDSADREAQALADSIENLNAWRGATGRAPVSDQERRSLELGQQIARDHAAKTAASNATVDRLLADQEAAYQASKASLNAWRGDAAVRDAIRNARYAG